MGRVVRSPSLLSMGNLHHKQQATIAHAQMLRNPKRHVDPTSKEMEEATTEYQLNHASRSPLLVAPGSACRIISPWIYIQILDMGKPSSFISVKLHC
jgi:hypothetical protein